MQEGNHTSAPGQVGSLFSTVATDNAEVVPPDAHRGYDQMWSTEARPEPEEPVDGELLDEPPGPEPGADPFADARATRNGRSRAAGLFSADPVIRSDDVIDEAEPPLDGEPPPYHAGSHAGADARAARPSAPPGERLFSSGGVTDPWIPAGPAPAGGGAGPASPPPFRPDERAHGAREGLPTVPPPYRHAGLRGDVGVDADAADPNGLRAALRRLDPAEVERTSVPVAVCGALLHEDEQVLCAVVGQMLGRPAVIVLTGERLLVVNDRRWQPIVDEFPLDSSLVVRGRHDRDVAALSFADSTRLSMVDGITSVPVAIELAERIREVGGVAHTPPNGV